MRASIWPLVFLIIWLVIWTLVTTLFQVQFLFRFADKTPCQHLPELRELLSIMVFSC